jgi:hypothetical protein
MYLGSSAHEVSLGRDVHANRLRIRRTEVPGKDRVSQRFVAGVDPLLGRVLWQIVKEVSVVVEQRPAISRGPAPSFSAYRTSHSAPRCSTHQERQTI